jgi:hypothetical protein
MSAADRAKAAALADVFACLQRHNIALDDLINIGGDDLKDQRLAAKARRVESCWSLMASLKVVLADLEAASGEVCTERPSARRGEGHILEATENIKDNPLGTQEPKPLETNDISHNAPVEVLPVGAAGAKSRWQHKRRLKSPDASAANTAQSPHTTPEAA